jgi:hypothetical protein
MKYYIHDNGGRPFLVDCNIKNGEVLVYKDISNYDNDTKENYSKKPTIKFIAKKIFIGKSPLNEMTKFSGGHGKDFDGNSILLHIDGNKYVHIGSEILSFESISKITKFVSPVGNSDVPYPFCVDNKKNIYLLIENVILKLMKKMPKDPYEYYYDKAVIIPKNNLEITGYYIAGKSYTFTYKSSPAKDYNSLILRLGSPISVNYKGSEKKIVLTKSQYIKIMKKIGEDKGFIPLNKKVLIKRVYG